MIQKVKPNVQNSVFVQYRKPSTHYFAIDDDIHIIENNLAYYVTSQNIYKLLNIYNCTEQRVILICFVYESVGQSKNTMLSDVGKRIGRYLRYAYCRNKNLNKDFCDVSAAIIKK